MVKDVRFGVLGSLEVEIDGCPVDLGRPKQRAVLAALLVSANRVVSLDRFVEILWPEGPGARSTQSLPVYIANLRRLLEPDRPARMPPQRLLTRPPGYLLQVSAGEYDAIEFETLAGEGRRHLADGRPQAARVALGEALALWRGRALEEFPFSELEASRLEELRVAATEDGVEADLALGAHASVIAELERLVGEHPLRERLVGLLMVALYRSGRQVDALRAFTRARDYLGKELGVEPGRDLRRLEADILAQSPLLDWRPPPAEGPGPHARPASQPPPALAPDPLVGRTAELAALDDAIAHLGQASGGVVLVAGEPGIGKTRLAQEAAARAGARGCVVAWGRCFEGEGAPPFWPWIQILQALLADPDIEAVRAALGPDAPELARLVPEVKDVVGRLDPPPALDPAAARFRFFDAVGGFLGRLAERRPVVLVIDDVHWADLPSLELTAHLGERVPRQHALLIATYRDVDPPPDDRLTATLARLARQPGRLQLSLTGLSEAEVGQYMAREVGSEPAAGVVATVWARAAGNPFFVGELTRLLLSENALDEAHAQTTAVPWAVRQVIGRRLARLPPETRNLLTVAAVAGQEFDLRVVAAAAHVELDRALDLADLAVAAGVVSEQPAAVERLRFSHALVQETVYQEVAALRRARLHGQVADALEALHGDQAPATEVAHHLYEAVPVVGPMRAVAAAIRASTLAQAALAYEVAEEQLRRALGLIAALPPGRERDSVELDVQDHLAALLTLVKGVAVPETAAAWARAAELCREVEDRRRLFPSLWGTFSFAWASGDLDGGWAMGQHIFHLGQSSSEPVVTAAAHLGLGGVALCRGDLAEARHQLALGKELADRVPDHTLAEVTHADLRVQVDSWLGLAYHLAGDHGAGGPLADGACRRALALGDTFTVAIGLSFAVFALVLQGDVARARELAGELLDHSDRHQLADFALHASTARIWTLAVDGAPAASIAALLESMPPAVEAGIRPWRPFWLALQAEVWQRIGRPDEARRAVDAALGEVGAIGGSFCAAELYRLRGELRAATGDQQGAVADLDEAVRLAGAQGALVYRDRAKMSRARIAGREGG